MNWTIGFDGTVSIYRTRSTDHGIFHEFIWFDENRAIYHTAYYIDEFLTRSPSIPLDAECHTLLMKCISNIKSQDDIDHWRDLINELLGIAISNNIYIGSARKSEIVMKY